MATRAAQHPRVEQLVVELDEPGMTAVHRAGLAGLAATLQALDPSQAPAGSRWEIHERHVVLAWSDPGPEPLLEYLLKQGLYIDPRYHLIDFPAWRDRLGNSASLEARIFAQKSLLGTFIQHGKMRNIVKNKSIQLDPDARTPPILYTGLEDFEHQRWAADLAQAIVKGEHIGLTGAFLPGAVEKHPGKTFSRMEATPSQMLALCFAPVGCLVFQIKSRTQAKRQQYALLVPEIRDLTRYGRVLQQVAQWGSERLIVPSAADAALQFALMESKRLRRARGQRFCSLIAMGDQPWNAQQKVRTLALAVEKPEDNDLDLYGYAQNLVEFQTRQLLSKDGQSTWFATSPSRGALAQAIVEGRPWWQGVAEAFIAADKDTRALFLHTNERGGIFKMTQRYASQGPSAAQEMLFVNACHEAMRQLYGSIGDQTKSAGTIFGQKAAKEMTQIRASLLRAKNAESFRQTLMGFWARASRDKVRLNKALRGADPTDTSAGWMQVLTFLEEKNWRKGRDLAILALLSYPGKEQDEQEEQVADVEVEG